MGNAGSSGRLGIIRLCLVPSVVPAPECPRIPASFLEEERQTLPECVFRQDYLCAFTSADDAVFPEELIQAALCDDLKPLFAPGREPF
jgi:hypothetical protein